MAGFKSLKLISFGIISVLVVACADLGKGLKNCSIELAYQNGFDASDKGNCNQEKALEVALAKSKLSNEVNLDFTGHFCENSKHYPFEKYKKDYIDLFKKEFCKIEKIKEIAKYDAQDFILKKSKSNFNVCNDQSFYSVYLKEYSESIKSSCSSMSVISKKGRSFAQNNRKINEGHELIKAVCPKNLVKSATRFFTLAYLSATAIHSYKNNLESQGVLSTKEEALLLEKIKLDREKKQEAVQKKFRIAYLIHSGTGINKIYGSSAYV